MDVAWFILRSSHSCFVDTRKVRSFERKDSISLANMNPAPDLLLKCFLFGLFRMLTARRRDYDAGLETARNTEVGRQTTHFRLLHTFA